MKYLRDNEFSTLPYGIFVTLAKDESITQAVFETTNPRPYRTDVTITLPASQQKEWIGQVIKALAFVQGGDRWTVHFEWSNVSAFFSPNQLCAIESPFRTVAFRCHESPLVLYSNSDTEYLAELERAARAKRKQSERNSRSYQKKCNFVRT